MNYNWYLIFDHLCFNANILQQATQSFCIFMTFFCNCRAYRIITKIIQIFCFGSQNFCTEIQKSCSIQHNYFVYLWIFLAFVWLLKLLQSFCNCVQKYIFNCNSFAKKCKKHFSNAFYLYWIANMLRILKLTNLQFFCKCFEK